MGNGRRAWSLRGLKRTDFKEVGAECLSFQADVLEFLANRQDAAPLREDLTRGTPEEVSRAAHEQWARNVQRSQQVGVRLNQKFAHRALALNIRLKNLGIAPAEMFSFEHSIGGIATYYGAIGVLLQAGSLTDARSVDPAMARHIHIYVT
jgi:hypothetical protein